MIDLAASEGPVHGSCIAFDGGAVLITGPSGAGKSGLALRLMALGATLISDDQVMLRRVGARIMARAPEVLRGLIEARGMGLIRVETLEEAPIVLICDLGKGSDARLPEEREQKLLGLNIPVIHGADVPNLAPALLIKLRGR